MVTDTHIKGASIFEVSSPEDSPTTIVVVDPPENPILQGFPKAVAMELLGMGAGGYESPIAFQLLSDLEDIESQLQGVDSSGRDVVLRLLKVVRQLTRVVDGQQSVINQLRAHRTIIK